MATRKGTEIAVDKDGPVRLHVNLNRPSATALKAVADRKDLTYTEAIRKAIGTLAWLDKKSEQGARFQIVEADGSIKEVVFDFAD